MASLWRRVVRVAQANLGDLADRATNIGQSGGRSLEEMSDAELERELERRRRDHATRGAVSEAKKKADRASDEKPRQRSVATDDAEEFLELSPRERRKVRQYYANLELPFGADFDAVKKSYRRLMRQYHPDKHQDDPARRKLATQLSQKLTVAYNELNQLFRKRKKNS